MPGAATEPWRADRGFLTAFVACSLAALVVLWLPKYLPLVDLPQHAAQIAIWKHLDDPRYGFGDTFRVQYFTPYLVANALARLFAEALPVLVAVKLVLTLAVLGLPLSLWRLLEVTGGDRWWALVGFPVAFGFSFLWGFFSYVAAIPLGVTYLAQVIDYREKLGARRAAGVAALTVLLFGTHLLPFALCGLSAAALLGIGARDLKTALQRLAPLSGGLLLAAAWASQYRTSDKLAPDVFRYGFERLRQLPALLFGYAYETPALVAGLLVMLLFVASGVRLSRRLERRIPLALWAAVYLGTPQDYAGVAFLYPRLAVWLVPCAIVATELGKPRVRPALVHGALACIALVWLGLLLPSFYWFDRDARDFDAVLNRLQPKKRVRSLVFERGDAYTPGGVPFLHFPVWYQVEKGGTTSFTFATSSLSVVVFRPETRQIIPAAIDWLPWQFDMSKEQNDFDYFVVRSASDLGPKLFGDAERRIYLIAHEGSWWVYGGRELLPSGVPRAR